jgi:hypothetical protein
MFTYTTTLEFKMTTQENPHSFSASDANLRLSSLAPFLQEYGKRLSGKEEAKGPIRVILDPGYSGRKLQRLLAQTYTLCTCCGEGTFSSPRSTSFPVGFVAFKDFESNRMGKVEAGSVFDLSGGWNTEAPSTVVEGYLNDFDFDKKFGSEEGKGEKNLQAK